MISLNPPRFIRAFLTGSTLAAAVFVMSLPSAQSAEPAAVLSINAQGMAPNQVVTLSTGPKQQLKATVAPNGSVSFNNLKYTPSTGLTFSLSYYVKSSGAKMIPNSVLMEFDPYMGKVGMKGQATKAASIIVNVSAEDSQSMIANQNGYFAGFADSISGFSDGNLRVVASIINVEENCCPRTLRPYAPVSINILSEPVKKANAAIIETISTASVEVALPEYSYGVSVPDKYVDQSWVTGIKNFGNQISKTIEAQKISMAGFIDAQNNSAALLASQKASAQSAKNYLPSEALCRYASLSQDLGASDGLRNMNKLSMMSLMQSNEMAQSKSFRNSKNANQRIVDKYKSSTCDELDANQAVKCKQENDRRSNMDIDYTSAIDVPLTIDIDFSDNKSQDQEQDIMSMAENLFPSRPINKTPDKPGYLQNSTQFRSIQAIRAIAKNTFVSQVAEKAQGTAGSLKFIQNLMLALGVSDAQSKGMMGERPSYYAQMEVLTKKIFQDPSFYVNLVDTPANVERQKAAIRAIKLQQQNDFAQVVKRREMLLAVLLEMKLRERSKMVEQRINPVTDQAKP